jgi:hypothetical protein
MRYPIKGEVRCSKHGGNAGRPILHGRYSKRYKRVSASHQRLVDQALNDKGLLDVKRSVAVQQALLQEAPLVPNGEQLEAVAMRLAIEDARKMRGQHGELEPVDIVVNEGHRLRALQEWLADSMKMADLLGRRQVEAVRYEKQAALLNQKILPFVENLATVWNRIAETYVPADQREDAIQAFRAACQKVVVEVMESLGE